MQHHLHVSGRLEKCQEDEGRLAILTEVPLLSTLCSLLSALCSLLSALCSLLSALCFTRSASLFQPAFLFISLLFALFFSAVDDTLD
jgi:hypothetical protein